MTATALQLRFPYVPLTKVHRLIRSDNFQTMWCGVELVDPAGELWTNDPAKVTCGNCLHLHERLQRKAQRQQRRQAARGQGVGAV